MGNHENKKRRGFRPLFSTAKILPAISRVYRICSGGCKAAENEALCMAFRLLPLTPSSLTELTTTLLRPPTELWAKGRMSTKLGLQARSLGQVHAEPIAAPLISAGHLDGCMTQLFLDIPLIYISTGSEAGSEAVTRE